jgi:hypothetical protein
VSRAQTTKTGVFGVLFSRKDPFEGLRYGNACTELPRLRHADRGAMDYGWIHCYVTRMKKFLTRSTLKTGSVILYFCLDHHVGMNATFLRANIFLHLLCYGVDYDNHIPNCDAFCLSSLQIAERSKRYYDPLTVNKLSTVFTYADGGTGRFNLKILK